MAWEVGDLALCIKQGPWNVVTFGRPVTAKIITGGVYRVTGLHVDEDGEFLSFDSEGDGLFLSSRFIKVSPPEADEFDRETIDLMLGKPVTQEQRNAEYFENIEAQMRRQMQGDD